MDNNCNNNEKVKTEDNKASDKKKLWLIIAAAAAAAAVLTVVLVIVPIAAPREEVKPAGAEDVHAGIEIAEPEQKEVFEEVELQREILPEYAELYERNSDMAGWIKIDGTVIDYPVMYTPDEPWYYLYRDFDGEEDPTRQGCIFIDENCVLEPRSTNLLIHGHNMKNGTMFHELLEYKDEEFYKEHRTIEFHTLYSRDEYEIVSVFLSKIYNKTDEVFKFYQFFDAETEEEFNDYIDSINTLELYDTGVTAEYGDELITLTTCEYTQDDGRMAVVAKKIK